MTARTLFDGGGARFGVAYTPFSRPFVPRRPRYRAETEREQKTLPPRSIYLGDMLSPDTGEVIGDAYLPLPSVKGANEAINVYGASGSGKSVLMRYLIEYFSIEEHRSVIILDITKNQYWAFGMPNRREEMVAALRRHGMKPTTVPDIDVYVPIYDEPVLGFDVMRRDWHATKLLSVKTSCLNAQSLFDLGDIDASGKMYQNLLEAVLNVPKNYRTVAYIGNALREMERDKSKAKSTPTLINLFDSLTQQGVIRDNGTDIHEMLHPPRKGRPGKISVISLGTSAPNDRRKKGLITSILQQLFDAVKDDLSLKPVLVTDETKEIAPKKQSDSPATYGMMGRIHLQCRAWEVTRVNGFQEQDHVADFLLGANTPVNISLTKSLMLSDGITKINDTGLGHVFIEGTGDRNIPDMDFLVKLVPCRTHHID